MLSSLVLASPTLTLCHSLHPPVTGPNIPIVSAHPSRSHSVIHRIITPISHLPSLQLPPHTFVSVPNRALDLEPEEPGGLGAGRGSLGAQLDSLRYRLAHLVPACLRLVRELICHVDALQGTLSGCCAGSTVSPFLVSRTMILHARARASCMHAHVCVLPLSCSSMSAHTHTLPPHRMHPRL